MTLRNPRINLLAACLALSLAVHSLGLCAVRMLGQCDLGPAVGAEPILVSLADPVETQTQRASAQSPAATPTREAAKEGAPSAADPSAEEGTTPAADAEAMAPVRREAPEEKAAEPEPERAQPRHVAVAEGRDPQAAPAPAPAPAAAPATATATPGVAATAATAANRPFAREEKLTYVISMLGVPVGSAELEAKNDERGTVLVLRVRSNPAMAAVYPVDDLVETRHVDGRYLMTKVRQREGAFRADESFSINLQQKRVTLTDNVRYRNLKLTVPTDQVLDTLSGIYSLRNRPLEVGKTETLHIFDSERYAEVPVEVVRREEMRLPNLTQVSALVVRPLQQTAGIFRRTGDILIWLTDDENRVPVRIVTTIALGRVTAELVSAETGAHGAEKGRMNEAAAGGS